MNDSAKRKGKYLYRANRAAHVSILWGNVTAEESTRLHRIESTLRENPAFQHLTFAPKDGYCGVIEEFDVHLYKGDHLFYSEGGHVVPLPVYMQVVGKGYFQYEK